MNNNALIIYVEDYFTKIEDSLKCILKAFANRTCKTVIIGNNINGDLILKDYSDAVIIPGSNQGLMAEAERYISMNRDICKCENIYLMSSSLAGPVCDINSMLDKMAEHDCSIMNKKNVRFVAVKGSLVNETISLMGLVNNCENIYSDTDLMLEPYTAVSRDRVPFVDMYAFVQETSDVLKFSAGEDIARVMDYIKKSSEYDENIIWDNILRDGHMSDVVYNLKLDYVLSADMSKNIPDRKIAMILHIYYSDLAPKCFEYAKSMPQISDIYITTDTREKCEEFKKLFMQGNFNKVESILIENRGRDVSALLTGAKKIVNNYDYVLFVHDKKVEHMDNRIKGESFAYKCFDNLLDSRDYVNNIINTFEANERLGLLCPPPPNHADYYPTLGYFDWGMNYGNTFELKEKLGLKVKLDWSKEPISPLGTMFWFRPKAMKLLFDKDWKYEDFPPEPNGIDGTLLHAIERIYSYIVQESGYYPAWVMSERNAGMEMCNLYYMIKKLDKKVFNVYGAAAFNPLCDSIENGNQNAEYIRSISTRKFIRYKLSGIYRRLFGKKE